MLGAREVDRIERAKLRRKEPAGGVEPAQLQPTPALRTGGCRLAIGTPVRSVRL